MCYQLTAANLTKKKLQLTTDYLTQTDTEGDPLQYGDVTTFDLPLAKKVKYSADMLESDGLTPIKANTNAKLQKVFTEHLNYVNHMYLTVKNGKVTKILVDDLVD